MRCRIYRVAAAVAAAACVFTAGCANRATGSVAADVDLSRMRSFYVVKLPADSRGVEVLIRDNLVKRGFKAASGPEVPDSPIEADAVVTYADRWTWDMTMYMLELTITMKNPADNFPFATGNSYHTSLTRKSPQEMVDEVLSNIFAHASEKKAASEK